MANRELGFSTFLKLLELSEPQKAATLRGFLRGGGFNYWRPLQQLAPKVCAGKLPLSELQEMVAQMSKGHQRKYNDHALTILLKWASRRRVQIRTRPERLIKKFGESGLSVRLEPELAFTMDGRNYLMHVWATNSPFLSEETLSMGLHFFRGAYKADEFRSCQFLIFDVIKDRIFAEFSILENTHSMLKRQEEVLGTLWANLNAGEPEKRKPEGTHPSPVPPSPIH